MRYKRTAIVLVLLMILAAGCAQANKSGQGSQSAPDATQSTEITNLCYMPVSTKLLEEGQPGENLIIGKSMNLDEVPKQIGAAIYLYVEKGLGGMGPNTGAAYGFLAYEGKLYELGEVSNYGLEDVKVEVSDKTFDGIKEVVITGPKGAAYEEMNVISYNVSTKEWTNILTMGSPLVVDLDNDGAEELVAVSTGSLPSFVDIYRWNQDHFEGASVTGAIGSDYAQVNNQNGQWVIESGRIENGKVEMPQYYRYEDGKLTGIGAAQ